MHFHFYRYIIPYYFIFVNSKTKKLSLKRKDSSAAGGDFRMTKQGLVDEAAGLDLPEVAVNALGFLN